MAKLPKKPVQHTCVFRGVLTGEAKNAVNMDEWYEVGVDRVCSFCGSMRADDFLSWCERALEADSRTKIEPAPDHGTGSDLKLLIHRVGINSAYDGALHFYTKHLDSKDEDEICNNWVLIKQVMNYTSRRRPATKVRAS